MVLTPLTVTMTTENYKCPLYLQVLEVISDEHGIDPIGSYHGNKYIIMSTIILQFREVIPDEHDIDPIDGYHGNSELQMSFVFTVFGGDIRQSMY